MVFIKQLLRSGKENKIIFFLGLLGTSKDRFANFRLNSFGFHCSLCNSRIGCVGHNPLFKRLRYIRQIFLFVWRDRQWIKSFGLLLLRWLNSQTKASPLFHSAFPRSFEQVEFASFPSVSFIVFIFILFTNRQKFID